MKLCFATNNPNKLAEIRGILGDTFEVASLEETGHNGDLPENQDTLEGNSEGKAAYVFQNYHWPCFADDTGLEVAALNGGPGVYSARYAGPQKSADDNMHLLLENLKGQPNRNAQFKTVITLITPEEVKLFTGVVKGRIIEAMKGQQGFGYDPVFIPDGHEVTFAEMSAEEKNAISHRGQAVRKLVDYLKEHYA